MQTIAQTQSWQACSKHTQIHLNHKHELITQISAQTQASHAVRSITMEADIYMFVNMRDQINHKQTPCIACLAQN